MKRCLQKQTALEPNGCKRLLTPLFYRRVKTDKAFHRPMNRVVHAHLKNILTIPQPTAFSALL